MLTEWSICIIAIFRAILNADSHYMKKNFPSYAGVACLLGGLETNLSIVNACLPVMQPVITKVSTKLKSTFSSSRRTSDNGSSTFNSKDQQNAFRLGSAEKRKSGSLEGHPTAFSFDDTLPGSLGSTNESIVTVSETKEAACVENENESCRYYLQQSVKPPDGIGVTKAWTVSSAKSPKGRKKFWCQSPISSLLIPF